MRLGRLGGAIALLALLGLLVAGYLTYVHYADIEPVCSGISDCEKVQASKWSELAGVPVALIGLLGYAAILVLVRVPGELGVMGTALASYVGFGFSAWLTYLELFEIEAICQWCVVSAVLITAIAVLATVRAARA